MAHTYIDYLEDVGAFDGLTGLPAALDVGFDFPPPYVPLPPAFAHAMDDGGDTEVVGASGAPASVPSPELAASDAYLIPFWDLDLYERIHIIPITIDFGNILQDQSTTFRIWNAYAVGQALNSIGETATTGLTLIEPTPPGPAPTTFPPLSEFTYTLQVATEGPAAIDALYEFVFDLETPRLTVTGSRIIAWTFSPQNDVQETLGWKTDIMESLAGYEQRVATRQLPRQTFRYRTLVPRSRERGWILSRLINRQGGTFAVPVWNFTRKLTTAATIGQSIIRLDTTSADFRSSTADKTELCLLWRDYDDYEVGQIAVGGVAASAITLLLPLGQNHPIGTYVIPMQLMIPKDPTTWKSTPNGMMDLSVDWLSQEVVSLANDGGLPTYESLLVLEDLNIQPEGVEEQMLRKYDLFDSETGSFETLYQRDVPEFATSKGWETHTAATSWALRRLIYALRGRQRSFWLPTYRADFTLRDTVGAANTTLNVDNVEYYRWVEQQAPFDRILVRMRDGTSYYRKITGSVLDGSGAFETLTIDSSFGTTINPTDVLFICYLLRARLGTDNVEITHPRLNTMSVRVPIIAVLQ